MRPSTWRALLTEAWILEAVVLLASLSGVVVADDAEQSSERPVFRLQDRFRDRLAGEFHVEGEVETEDGRFELAEDAAVVWETDSGAQFGLEFTPQWPPRQIDSVVHLELILVPQSQREFGFTAIASGKPCGLSIRSLHFNGKHMWDLTLRSYRPSLRVERTLVRRLVEPSELPETVRLTYNNGVLSLRLQGGDVLTAHVDNYCAEVRKIRIRNSGRPVVVDDIRGSRGPRGKVPSLTGRLSLGRAALQDAQSARLIRQKKFAEALEVQLPIYETCSAILGPQHFYSIRSAVTLARLRRLTGQLEPADQLLRKTEQLVLTEFGPAHPETAGLLEERAAVAVHAQNWEQAEGLYRRAYRIRKHQAGYSFDKYLAYRAEELESQRDWAPAILVGQKTLELCRQTYPAGHWKIHEATSEVARVRHKSTLTDDQLEQLMRAEELIDSAAQLMDTGRLPDALAKAEQAFEIRKQVVGLENRHTAVAATYLGLISGKLARHRECLEHYSTDLQVTRKVLGDQHPESAAVLNNVAQALIQVGQYEQSADLHQQALAIREENRATNPADYAESLSNLGRLYAFSLGEIERGLPLIEESYRVRLRHFASDSLEVSRSLNNLGHCYQRIGDTGRAIDHFRRSLEIKRSTTGEESVGYAVTLTALGNALSNEGRHAEAKAHLLRAVRTIETLAGKDNVYYPQFNNYLAAALDGLGETDEALRRYQESLEIRASQVGADSLDCGEIHLNLSRTHLDSGDFANAWTHCRAAERIIKQAVQPGHRSYRSVESLRVRLHIASGEQLEEAFEINSRLLKTSQRQLERRLPLLSESQQIAQLAVLRTQLHQHLHLGRVTGRPAEEIYEQVLTWKSVIAFRTLTDKLVRSPEVNEVQRQLATVRDRLARHVFRSDQTDGKDYLRGLQQLEAEKQRLQRLAALQASQTQRQWAVGPRQLAEQLAPDQVLLDFFRVRLPSGVARFHVFVVRRPAADGAPWLDWLDLGSAEEARQNISLWRSSIEEGTDDADVARRLRRQLWTPIEDCLGGPPKYAYLCPDGLLAQLPWAALPGAEPGRFLIEETTLVTLPLSQYLSIQQPDEERTAEESRLLLVGNLDYNAEAGAGPDAPFLVRGVALGPQQRAFAPLPATRGEILAIERISSPRPVTKLERGSATTRATIAELQHAHYAHFASHGFFARPVGAAEDADDDSSQHRDVALVRNPFLLSGLVLSGANGRSSETSELGGILSAEAIASLPLDQLRLVTLSACETQLGGVAQGEGVYGLQRAFHLAGAEHVVASLWKVEDQATATLMKLFYHYLWDKRLPPADALRRAQLALLREPRIVRSQKALDAVLTRGLNVAKPVNVDNTPGASPPAARPTRALIRQWAAFSVSGR